MKKGKIFGFFLVLLATLFSSTLVSCGSENIEQEKLVIGMECGYQPFNWTVQSESEYTLPIDGTTEFADGYDIQIAKYLSEDLNREVVIKRIVWDSLVPELNSGNINMILAGMSSTAERRESIDFTDPYLTSELAFLVRKDTLPEGNSAENPMKYEDLLELFKGEHLISQRGVVGDDFIEKYFTGVDPTIIHNDPLATYPLAANDVSQGTSFAMPAELPVCEAMVNIDPNTLGILYVDQSFLEASDLEGYYEDVKDEDFSASVLFLSKAVLNMLRHYHFSIYKNVLEISKFSNPNMTTVYDFLYPLMNDETIQKLCDEGFGESSMWIEHRSMLQQIYTALNRAEYDFINYETLQEIKSILFDKNGLLNIIKLI